MRAFSLYVIFLIFVSFPALAQTEDTQLSYSAPDLANISKLYWRLGVLDIDNDVYVDNYLRINECDIYRDYWNNELEWEDVRRATRDNIKDNLKGFPLRFEFMQRINLGEYDVKGKGFYVTDEYIINNKKDFRMPSSDINAKICVITRDKEFLDGYPRELIIELSRPFDLHFVPVEEDIAKIFIQESLDKFTQLRRLNQTKQNLYGFRPAYMFFKVRFFAYTGDRRTIDGKILPSFLAALESFELYADEEKQKPLYAQTFRRDRSNSELEEKLIEKFQKQKQQFEKRKEKIDDLKDQNSEGASN